MNDEKPKATAEKTYTIIKTSRYRGSIRPMIGGDKQKALEFDEGKPIKVNKEQLDNIKALGWCNLHKQKIEKEKTGDN